MPKRGIDYCLDVIAYLKNKGYEKDVPATEVVSAIHLNIGFAPKVRAKYLQMLGELDLMRNSAPGVFTINDELVSTLTK